MASMRLIPFIALLVTTVYGQDKTPSGEHRKHGSKFVSVTAVFHKSNATKDGYYFGRYVVEIDPARAAQLDGKKLKITGRLFIEKGLNAGEQKTAVVQGRSGDTKHISSPKIEIVGTSSRAN